MYMPISIHHKIENNEKLPTRKVFKKEYLLMANASITINKNNKKRNALGEKQLIVGIL